jgi:hypothetical protein
MIIEAGVYEQNPILALQNTLGKITSGDFDIELDDIEFVGGFGISLEYVAENHGARKQALADFFVIFKQNFL